MVKTQMQPTKIKKCTEMFTKQKIKFLIMPKTLSVMFMFKVEQ